MQVAPDCRNVVIIRPGIGFRKTVLVCKQRTVTLPDALIYYLPYRPLFKTPSSNISEAKRGIGSESSPNADTAVTAPLDTLTESSCPTDVRRECSKADSVD
ncbi:hypothetical protein ISCGN_014447 [Ixodes scapularis]